MNEASMSGKRNHRHGDASLDASENQTNSQLDPINDFKREMVTLLDEP